MMKRLLSLSLSLLMLLSLAVPAASAAETKPTPPAWVKAEEYTVFEDDSTYTGETWETVLRLRADAAAGNLEPQSGDLYTDWNMGESYGAPASLRFELGLIGMKYAENSGGQRKASSARRYFSLAQSEWLREGGSRTDGTYYLLTLWYQRARLLECRPGTSQVFSGYQLEEFLKASGCTVEQFLDCPALSVVTKEEWAAIQARIPKERAAAELAATRANVNLDGNRVNTENLARVVNGRTMIPVRCLAEQLGADVSYDTALKAARIVRAGVEIIMPIGSRTCTVNGKPFTMDIAPYIENGRTMIPARYVSELFGQSIEWVPEGRIAAVTENKALAGDTNLEPWAMAMGAYLNAANNGGRPTVFGSKGRGLSYSMDAIGNHSAAGTLYTYGHHRPGGPDRNGVPHDLLRSQRRFPGLCSNDQRDVGSGIPGAAEQRGGHGRLYVPLHQAAGREVGRPGHPLLGSVPHEQSGPVGLRGGLSYLSRGFGPAGAGGHAAAEELQELERGL